MAKLSRRPSKTKPVKPVDSLRSARSDRPASPAEPARPGRPAPPAARPRRPPAKLAAHPRRPPPEPVAPTGPAQPPGARRSPADELEARLLEPEEGAFLKGVDRRVIYPTLIGKITEAGHRIVEVLTKYDSPDLFLGYEALEFEVAEVRERAAFGLGWEHGSADGRAEAFRSHAPGLSEQAQRLADRARALVVNEGLSVVEATALLLETAWSVLLASPAPPFDEG